MTTIDAGGGAGAAAGILDLAVACVRDMTEMSDDDVAQVYVTLKAYIARGTELKRQLDDALAARMTATGRDIRFTVDGDGNEIILTTRPEKVVKCRDVKAALQELLQAFGGDFDMLADCLASGAFKYGACRKRLEEIGAPGLYEALFETSERVRVEEKGAKVREVNTKFIK